MNVITTGITPDGIQNITPDITNILSRILGTSEIQSLIRLGNLDNPSQYFTATPFMSIGDQPIESFIEHLNQRNMRNPNLIGLRFKDLKIISGLLQNMEELRNIALNGLLTTTSVRDLFAIMAQDGKVSISDLKPEDGEIFGFLPLQMNYFINIGSPIICFSDGINKQISGLIN